MKRLLMPIALRVAIKLRLTKIKRLKFIIRFISGLFSDDFVSFINEENPNRFELVSHGKFLPDKVVYLINYNNNVSGLFAMLLDGLICMDFAHQNHLTPIIFIGSKTHYYDAQFSESISSDNVFDYFFENNDQIRLNSINEISFNKVIRARGIDRSVILNTHYNSTTNLYNYALSDEAIDRFSLIYNRFIKINPYTISAVRNDIHDLKLEGKFISVHFRGTDFRLNTNNHPTHIQETVYFGHIDRLLEQQSELKIFLATDDVKTVIKFREKYGDLLFYFYHNKRSIDRATIYSNENRPSDRYLNGYEVIRDAYLLSKGEYFLGGLSNVATFARVLNRSSSNKFIKEIILNSGVNKNLKNIKENIRKVN